MEAENIMPASAFCMHHNIELSFINSLRDYGMIETVVIEEQLFFPMTELERLEKIVHLHYELDINLEGIETITHLLQRMNEMREQIIQLTNRLKVYENS